MRFAASTRTLAEAIYVYRGGSDEGAYERERVDLSDIIERRLLEVLSLETEEEYAAFVDFAAVLDDGEAEACALAIRRGLAVATDDRKVLRVLKTQHPSVPVVTTAGIVKHWAEASRISDAILQAALLDIEIRARFKPPKTDELQTWWLSMTRGT